MAQPYVISADLASAYQATQSAELDMGRARHALPPDWLPPHLRKRDDDAPTKPHPTQSEPPVPTAAVSGPKSAGPTTGRPVDNPSTVNPDQEGATTVSQLDGAISDLLSIDGATGAAIVDITSGMALAAGGNPGFDLSIAAAGNSNVIRAKLKTMQDLGLRGRIDDILITLDEQYHLINVLADGTNEGLFIYLVLNRDAANLALARHKLAAAARTIQV